jgi:transcriptional regulator of acetoin/glycerol metabolism
MGITVPSAPHERPRAARASQSVDIPKDEIAEALRLEKGNVSRAANRLGVHRNKVRRWLERNGIERSAFGESDD